MGRIIARYKSKRVGSGKTTTSINLTLSIAEMGKRLFTIDLDPQGKHDSGLMVDKMRLRITVYERCWMNVPSMRVFRIPL